ncbi:MAG: CPBP family intramembrane metalloprotease [Okeania sp. SIO2H7]|nr:CPBP family intramembrane metalloprotease [Okeania sp. SIO2H7]
MKKSLVDGAIFSFAGVLIIFCLSWLIDTIAPGYELTQKFLNISLPPIWLTYIFHCYLQELVRAISQVSLEKFLLDEKGYYAIFISSVVFAIFHVHLGFIAMVITMIAGNIFGFIYSRTYNLAGVTLVHFILGFVVARMSLLRTVSGG